MGKGEKKTIVGFDLDGVIIDHAELKSRLAKEFGCELKIEETGSEVMKNILPGKIYEKIQHLIYENPEKATSQPLMAGARENLRKIKEIFPCCLISRRRSEQGKRNAIELLKIHKLWPDYFNEKNVFFVPLREDKNTKARELGVTHYVDDERKVLECLKDVENKFLFDPFGAPEPPAGCAAVKSWNELSSCFLENK